MALNKLLEDNKAWLDQAVKQRIFDRIDERALALPEEQRQRRIADLKARIDSLAQRQADAAASYDRVIALEKAELDALMAQKPPQAPMRAMKPMAARKKARKKK
jgi:hypothetical protein